MSDLKMKAVVKRWRKALEAVKLTPEQAEEIATIMSEIYMTRNDVMGFLEKEGRLNREARTSVDSRLLDVQEKVTALNTEKSVNEKNTATLYKRIALVSTLIAILLGTVQLWKVVLPLL